MPEQQSFLEQVFDSYKRHIGPLAQDLTLALWLDGPNGWRRQLREIGRSAARAVQLRNAGNARLHWRNVRNAQPWMRPYFVSVPLLNRLFSQGDYDDVALMQALNGLATFAEL